MNCLVSVIMSIYNEKLEWIQESVQSILEQTYSNIEFIIVVDNPNLSEDILNYLKEVSNLDDRLIIIQNDENLGLALALNRGILIARGIYIARMDADDISMPERIKEELMFILNSSVDLVGTGRYCINEFGEIVGQYVSPVVSSDKINKILPLTSCLIHPTVMIRTDVLKSVGGYRDFKQSQDYDLWLRLLSNGYKFANIDKPLLKYRLRDGSISLKQPYVQYMTSQYQRRLYKMRKRTDTDKFSKEDLKEYLNSYKAFDDKKNAQYTKSLETMDTGIHKLKLKDPRGLLSIVKSIIMFPEMIGVLYKKIRGIYIIRN